MFAPDAGAVSGCLLGDSGDTAAVAEAAEVSDDASRCGD
jgi:hypothetical protein